MKLRKMLAILLFIPLITTIFAVNTTLVRAQDSVTFRSVLDTDNYLNYPWLEKSFSVGISKYGEIIDESTMTGLEYGLRDAFANERIDPIEYQNGWHLAIRYHSTVGGGDRYVWATAIFSDLRSYGGGWKNSTAGLSSAPYGGRKTNGAAWSEPIEVIHDGPRRAVVRMKTHIMDEYLTGRFNPVADLTTLVIINKVNKYIMIIDDIVLTVPKTIMRPGEPADIVFNRQSKWYLGPWPHQESDVYFFKNRATVYGINWHTHGPIAGFGGFYDVAQLVGGDYVGFAAFWPQTTEYAANAHGPTADYWGRELPPGTAIQTAPTTIPMVIGQWRFQLGYAGSLAPYDVLQFRAVTIYGIVDRHNGDNNPIAPILDDEVRYILDDVIFNPSFNLNSIGTTPPVHTFNTVVGRDSAAADSTAVMATQSALISVGHNSGIGLLDMSSDGSPWACRRYGTTNDRNSYYYNWPTDKRSGFMTTDPLTGTTIVGQPMIVAGGPYANLAAEYYNDFTPVFAIGDWMAWNHIFCPGCWSHHMYTSYGNTGYAIIATCTDTNMTDALVVWGWTASDTYQAGSYISTLLGTLPAGATGVVIEINYGTSPPSISVVECLCVFTEYDTLGGIHTP